MAICFSCMTINLNPNIYLWDIIFHVQRTEKNPNWDNGDNGVINLTRSIKKRIIFKYHLLLYRRKKSLVYPRFFGCTNSSKLKQNQLHLSFHWQQYPETLAFLPLNMELRKQYDFSIRNSPHHFQFAFHDSEKLHCSYYFCKVWADLVV